MLRGMRVTKFNNQEEGFLHRISKICNQEVSLVVEQRQPLLDLKQVQWRKGFYQHVAAEDETLDLVPMNSSMMMMLM
jgi:hypothetical protein